MNPNTVWARTLVQELARSGVTDVCMAPGSRSTPLVLAVARQEGLRLRVFIDERSAAFFALGLGQATGRPAAVVTTSGTAVANLLPAVVEASQAEVPLLVLTADRPPRLRDADANQTIAQVGLFGGFVRWSAELAAAEVDDAALRHLRVQAARAVAEARGLPGGPVHLDVPFDKPLEPHPDDARALEGLPPSAARGRGDGPGAAPFTRIGVRRPRLGDEEIGALAKRLGSARRCVVVAGPHPEAAALGPLVRRLAGTSGCLVLADPLSQARWPAPDPQVASCVAHDLWLGDDRLAAALEPDLILRLGAAPTSAPVVRWLARHAGVFQTVIDAGHRHKDHQAVAHEVLRGCPVDALARLLPQLESTTDRSWSERWVAVDAAAAAAVEADSGEVVHEGHLARAVVSALDPETPLFVSSSMPVRDVDGFGGSRDRPLSVFGNRGASGIDGIMSTALGVSAGKGAPVVALVGDLAFLHDVNGLLATREPDTAVVFVVVNNDGGGIFHMLPVAEHEPEFTPYFATPHGVEPERAAALYRVPFRSAAGPDELVEELREALATGRSCVVEVRTERAANQKAHARARRTAQGAAGATYDEG